MTEKLKLTRGCAALITDTVQRLYFTGFESSFGYLLITDTNCTLYTDKRYLFAAKQAGAKRGFEVLQYTGTDEIAKRISSGGVTCLGIDYSLTTVAEYNSYKQFGVEFYDISGELSAVFAVKSADEIKNIEKACAIAQDALKQTLETVREGITEKQFADALEHNMHLLGGEKPSFDTIAAFGENTAVPHHKTGNTALKYGMPILVDFGCKYNGYCSDCTRTFSFGAPTEEFIAAYKEVLAANLLAEQNIVPEMLCVEADKLARDSLAKAGLGEYFTHSLGHGIGLNIHEFPYVSPKGNTALKNGMVFSIEPGVYLDGKFGIRIEDTVVLDHGRVRRLFSDGKDLKILK